MAVISGIQQIGIGVSDVMQAFEWYKKYFGMDVVIFDEKAPAEYMLPYTDGKPRSRHAILAMNMQGGGGFEIWQHTGVTPRAAAFDILPGDYGIYACKMKCLQIDKAYEFYKQNNVKQSKIFSDNLGRKYFYVTDPFNNLFQIVEISDKSKYCFVDNKLLTGGAYGAIVGVKNIDEAVNFYTEILGYDKVLSNKEGEFEDFTELSGENNAYRRVLLTHTNPRRGAFSPLLGDSEIELVEVLNRETAVNKIFEGRMWGELGFIQICYDIRNMDSLREKVSAKKYAFTVDSKVLNPNFDMGEAAGHFAYNEDPSGTLIEYVETLKIPILKKFNLFLDTAKYGETKNIPKCMLWCLRFLRK